MDTTFFASKAGFLLMSFEITFCLALLKAMLIYLGGLCVYLI